MQKFSDFAPPNATRTSSKSPCFSYLMLSVLNLVVLRMKRNPRKVRWTKAFRKAAGKEMTIDSTLDFEKRRNIPVRYDRELVQATVKAMKRVGEIRKRRELAFWKTRRVAKKAWNGRIANLQYCTEWPPVGTSIVPIAKRPWKQPSLLLSRAYCHQQQPHQKSRKRSKQNLAVHLCKAKADQWVWIWIECAFYLRVCTILRSMFLFVLGLVLLPYVWLQRVVKPKHCFANSFRDANA
ncbi:Ribosome biogenesis protein rlp24 [Mycena indigotica]|uniref:Ribosome biogenesis protein rlp24 n=1 Tax=Mycena indigotica TaxID=2126181 RepID=A0A8H6S8P1_9AGAR|nr:Ribosome biogenesis protein rlp24 [Mycena indigotica]KAF7294874.1 Ribosome biogenesis protein rlp24 [Mycena indigotica]